MRSFYFSLFVMGIALTCAIQSQAQILTAERHIPYTTDSVLAYKLPYIAIADSGRNCMWNLANLPMDSAKYIDVNYFAPTADTTHIGLHREQVNYYYEYKHDTLWMMGHETSHTHVRYDNSIPFLRFPMAYGDSVCAAFSGEGRYCHTHSFSVEGKSKVHVDAVGQLILPDMVIDSVLRVCARKRYSATMHYQSDVEEEHYLLFSPYGHYPLFETIRIQTVTGQDSGLFASSYYFLTDDDLSILRRFPKDTLNEPIDSLITNVQYMPNPVSTDLQVQYTLMKSAHVYISVHYNGGISTYQTPVRYEDEGTHRVYIPMGGIPIGNYIVYIHADNMVVSGDVIKL